MPQIRPITDLRNTTEISNLCHARKEPIFITKNGYGDMVVLSYEEYTRLQYDMMVVRELRAAELEAETTTERYAHEDVMRDLRVQIAAARQEHV